MPIVWVPVYGDAINKLQECLKQEMAKQMPLLNTMPLTCCKPIITHIFEGEKFDKINADFTMGCQRSKPPPAFNNNDSFFKRIEEESKGTPLNLDQ
jgi:hypothetical protein